MLRARFALLLAPAILGLAACGGAEAITSSGQTPLVVSASVSTPVSWSESPDLDARTAEVMVTAAEVWGSAPFDAHGISIVYTDALIDCAGARAVGCATGSRAQGWRVQVLATGAPCVEATTLPHELGHVILGGDPGHTDPRWRDPAFWTLMADRLARSSAQADPACVAFLEGDGVFRVDSHQ